MSIKSLLTCLAFKIYLIHLILSLPHQLSVKLINSSFIHHCIDLLVTLMQKQNMRRAASNRRWKVSWLFLERRKRLKQILPSLITVCRSERSITLSAVHKQQMSVWGINKHPESCSCLSITFSYGASSDNNTC